MIPRRKVVGKGGPDLVDTGARTTVVTAAPPADPSASRLDVRPLTRSSRFLLPLAVAVAAAPVVAAAVRRAARGWQPVQDQAAITRLTYDVFSRHTPLVGMPSLIGGQDRSGWPHHLGPMLFWVLAIPQRVFALSSTGLLVGVVLVNVAALAGVAFFVRRRAGTGAAVWALGLLTVAMFSLGAGELSTILNSDVPTFPFALFLVLAWSLAAGDALALPFAALVGTFIVQSHLVFVPIVVATGAWGVGAFVVLRRRERRVGLAPSSRAWRAELIVTAVIVVVGWSTAVYQVLTKLPGGGNVSRIVHSYLSDPGKPVGFRQGLHLMARSLGGLPLWARPYADESAHVFAAPPLMTNVIAFAVVAAAVVALVRVWRRDPVARALLITALLALVTAFWSASRMPSGLLGGVLGRIRFVWITGPFVVFALGVAVARMRPLPARSAARLVGAGALVALLVGGSALASTTGIPREPVDRSSIVRSLSRQLRDRLPRGRMYVQPGLEIAGVGTGVAWDLVRHGYDVRVPADDVYLAATNAAPRGSRVDTLFIVEAYDAFRINVPSTRIASYRVPRAMSARAERAMQRVCDRLTAHPATVSPIARSLRAQLPPDVAAVLARIDAGAEPPCALAREPGLPALVQFGLIAAPGLTPNEVFAARAQADRVKKYTYDVYLARGVDVDAMRTAVTPLRLPPTRRRTS